MAGRMDYLQQMVDMAGHPAWKSGRKAIGRVLRYAKQTYSSLI